MKKIILTSTFLFNLILMNCASLSSGDSVYLAALTGNDAALTKELLMTSDLNVRNADGNTALMWAVYNKNEFIVKKLVEHGAFVGFKDRYGNSTLSIGKTYLTSPSILETLRTGYQNQLNCPSIWQTIRGLLGLRQCVSFDGKSPTIEELDKYSRPSDGAITKISPVTVLKLLSQKSMESNSALLSKKNMSEKERLAEYRRVSATYESEGSSESNEITKDKFEVCQFKGDLNLEEIKYTKEKRSEIDKNYRNLLLNEDPDKDLWLMDNTSQFILPSIEDRHKFIELKKKIGLYTNGIVSDFDRFFAYNDLANEKTIEKDYQKMASMLAQIVIYKINNYKKRKENLAGCNLAAFAANDSLLEKLKSDAQKYLETLSKRVSNSKNAPLDAIRIKMMRGETVDNECSAILGDSPKKYDSHRDLAQALTWCYASISDPVRSEPYFKRINELSDPVALREAEGIKKDRAEGRPITMPSMGRAEKKEDSLPGPQSQKYKLAVLTFIDQTRTRKGELVRYALTDMLTSELYDTQRFALVDRDDLIQIERKHNSSKTVNKSEKTSKEQKEGKDDEAANEDKPVKEEISNSKSSMVKSYKATEMGPYDISTEYSLRRTEIERENMRGKDIGIDGYLLGYITSIDLQRQTMELDFRIVYPVNINREINVNPEDEDTERYIRSLRNLVVYGANSKVKFNYDEKREMIQISRSDIQNMAIGIKQAFADTETINKNLVETYEYLPEEDEFSGSTDSNSSKRKTVAKEVFNKEKAKPSLKVMKIEGDKIIINAGAVHKVRSGLIGYVIDSADFGTYRYLARFVVEQVFEKSARCILLEGAGNLSREGQSVIIK